MRDNLNSLIVERKVDKVILRSNGEIISEMDASFALHISELMVQQADKILSSLGDPEEGGAL